MENWVIFCNLVISDDASSSRGLPNILLDSISDNAVSFNFFLQLSPAETWLFVNFSLLSSVTDYANVMLCVLYIVTAKLKINDIHQRSASFSSLEFNTADPIVTHPSSSFILLPIL